MNFMPAVQIKADAEAFYDEEEFYSPSMVDVVVARSKWANAFLLLDMQESPTARVGDAAELWATKADDQFYDAILRAESAVQAALLFVGHNDEHVGVAQDNSPSESEGQLHLPISTSFTPSEELIQSWKNNASSYLDKEMLAATKSKEASAEFGRMLKRLIGAFAQEMRYAGERSVVVADRQGDFQPMLQLEISERFLLLPQKSTAFFSLLRRDLLACREMTIFSGGWGTFVRMPDDRLLIELKSQNLVQRDGFVKAQETRT